MAEWISVREAAQLAGYHEERIRELAREGKIRAKKFVTVWQINKKSLFAYIQRMNEKGKKRGPKSRNR